jgi:hypothetical protein
MTSITKKIFSLAFIAIAGSTVLSCYEKFDPESYNPPFTISGFTSVDEIAPGNLVGYWSFDGTLADAVSNDEASNSGASFVNGFKGQALDFDVANKSYATFDPSTEITGMGSFTISFWVNPTFIDADASGSIDGIIGFVNLSKPDGFWGNIDWFIENGSNPSSAKIVAHITNSTGETWMNVSNDPGLFDAWSSHTLTYDEGTSTFKYYINGGLKTTATASGWTGPITFVNSGPLVFGTVQFQTDPSIGCCGNQGWASYLTGSMDEIRIYDKALTAEEINAMVVLQGKGK